MRRLLRYLIVTLTLFIGGLFMFKYNAGFFSIYGDSMGYYIYLPATFVYGNLQDMNIEPQGVTMDAELLRYAKEMHASRQNLNEPHWVNQYTYAVALMEAPFFLAAHLYEKLTGLPADGLSMTYVWAIFFSGLFYTFLGLWLIYKVLKRYVSSLIAVITLALLVLGTNLFWFIFAQVGMSHTPIFFLYALIIYCTVRLHEHPSRKYFLTIGLSAGLITIMRPTDIVCLLIPLLYGVTGKQAIREKIVLIKTNITSITLAVVAFILPIIPQLLYWKWLTGKYFYYSYGEQRFFWNHPKIIEGLFQFSNGWLPYAPIMIFALLGLLIYRRQRQWLPVIAILLPLYAYTIYSWYCYNYINGFGSRPMIHLYPLLAIPLAHFLSWLSEKGHVAKLLFAAVSILSISVIFSLSSMMAQNKFRSENANLQFYTSSLFTNKVTYNTLVSWDLGEYQPDPNKLEKISTLECSDFNIPLTEHFVKDPDDTVGFIYHMYEGEEYFPHEIEIPYKKGMLGDAKWFRCSGEFMYVDYADHIPRIFVFGVKDKEGQFKVWKGCKIDNKIGISDSTCKHYGDSLLIQHYEYWKWSPVYFYTKVPDDLEEGDRIVLGMWNMNKKRLFFDNFCIELYK